MRAKDEASIVALVCSDIHLCHKKPVVRSPEPDWYDSMAYQLGQLRAMQSVNDCPVIIAGDIFDRWNSPPELINFALDQLPNKCYAIPGQHDLPNHNYEDAKRSAYYTLVASGKVTPLPGHKITKAPGLNLYSFPWGFDLLPLDKIDGEVNVNGLNLAIVHRYVWKRGFGYVGADKAKHTNAKRTVLIEYDAAVFGDNHKGFSHGNIYNCGTFLRRKADEIQYEPAVGVVWSDGTIERHYLDCSSDKFIAIEEALELVEKAIDMTDFAGALASLGSDGLDFVESVLRFLDRNKIADSVRQRVMEAVTSEKADTV